MKKFICNTLTCLLLLLFVGAINYCTAQNLKAVTLVAQRNYSLNGGARAMFGGKSRITLRVDLPANTRHWYYSFTTTPDEQGTQLLNLGLQVGAMIATSGTASVALSQLKVPPGSGSIDILVLPPTYESMFLNKDVGVRYFRDVSLENARQAVQVINPEYGRTLYLGLRNPSAVDGVNVQIEIVAVVEEQDKGADKGSMYCNLGWAAYKRGDLEKCIELSKKALSFNPDLTAAKFNIALVYLSQEAEGVLDEYVTVLAELKDDGNKLKILKAALEDIQELRIKKPEVRYLQDVEDLLQNEISRY